MYIGIGLWFHCRLLSVLRQACKLIVASWIWFIPNPAEIETVSLINLAASYMKGPITE